MIGLASLRKVARLLGGGAVTGALLATTACEPAVVGEWRSTKKVADGKRNKLKVEADNTGKAIVYATPSNAKGDWVRFKFDVEWTAYADEFELVMECDDGPCEGADFEMDCVVVDELNGEVDKLDCTGDGLWRGYPFDWERVVR